MPIKSRLKPMRFTPRGLVDAYDSTDKFAGACIIMQNLIFDPANPELAISRPGVSAYTNFGAFTTPGVVSVHVVVGDRVYGMISSGRTANYDEPFSFNLVTNTFDVVGGVTAFNVPLSQPTSGPWTPPTMAMVGVNLIVTHPGFPGGATKFGWFDLTAPGAPVWNAGDTTTNALPSVPTAVANFNNRAYFGCGQTMPYTDVLTLTRTASSQALTVGDTSPIIALAGLPIQTTSSGVIQTMMVFKESSIWQVIGDAALSNLTLNYLSLTVGTRSARSVVQSPLGLYFASTAGPYVIDNTGIVRNVVHSAQELESDIVVPWQNAQEPTRIAAGYASATYVICMSTIVRDTAANNVYWFDEHKRRWTGPHTFTFDCAAQYKKDLVVVSNANPANLCKVETQPSTATVYTDLGIQYNYTLQSSLFPKTGMMIVKQSAEGTIELGTVGGASTYEMTALDEIGNTIDSCEVTIAAQGSLWGSGVFGAFKWGGSINIPKTYTVPWTQPLVFKKMALYNSAISNGSVMIGTFFARYKDCGYTNTP